MAYKAGRRITTADTIDKLLWPPDGDPGPLTPQRSLTMRICNCLLRNNIGTISDLLAESPNELLRMRNFGEKSLAELVGYLDQHGWKLAENKPYDGVYRAPLWARKPRAVSSDAPEGLEEAEWIGCQLDVLLENAHVYAKSRLGGRWEGEGADLQNRRRAWAWYRWGIKPDADWPRDKDGGFGFMATPLPGSVGLHLEGLNRLAHEELGS